LPNQTIQKTDKQWKLMNLVGWLMILVGVPVSGAASTAGEMTLGRAQRHGRARRTWPHRRW
jgi:hypothetical protein